MYNLILTLDKRRSRKDGSYPIVFQISANSESRRIPTNYYCKITDWNNRSKTLKESHPYYSQIAPHLKELEIGYLSKLVLFKVFGNKSSIQKVKEYLTSVQVEQQPIIVKTFWLDEIEHLQNANSHGNAYIYQQALNAISKLADLSITFKEVDYNYLINLEVAFIGNGLSTNCISLYLRTFRAVFNKAIKCKIASRDDYPFSDFKIKKAPTIPRPITLEEMAQFFNLNIQIGTTLYDSWLMGKLSFMLLGINFTDLLHLKEANMKDGRINYIRSKTKTLYSIRMLQDVIEIIDYFKGRSEFTLLGKLTKEDLDNKRMLPKIIKQKNKTFNKHLNKLGKMFECNERLSSYVFRYSIANIAKQLGYSKDLISEALGHQYGSRTTGIYLEAYDKKLIDDMNHVIHLTVTMPKTTPTE
jgi:integrase